MDRFRLFALNCTQVSWKDDIVVDVIKCCNSICEAFKEIPSKGKVGALLLKHIICFTLCSIYFSNLIVDRGLNFTDLYALCGKVLLGENVQDLIIGGDVRKFKNEVVQQYI